MHQGKGKLLHSAAAAALLWATTVQAGPMSLDGQFSVSESGAATYTIPIQVPPGTGGVEPKLALTYNSQTGNGLLGVGWSLSGLSAITRCPRTLAQDNVRGSVNFDNNDRFCLDGQRLLAVNGTYGADGTEYRTERESYSKIVSYGTAGNGPAWFKVWTKAGQVIEYGNTADSRIEAIKAPNSTATWPTTTARLWAINKVADTKGNYLTYSYTEDQANGDYYPTRIDYTGNSNTGLTPNNSVQFVYEARPDVSSTFYGGALIKSIKRVNEIQLFGANDLLTKLVISYQVNSDTSKSVVTKVQQCPLSGQCLQPTNIELAVSSRGFVNDGAWVSGAYGSWYDYGNRIRPMDVNGDGLADMVLGPESSGNWYVMRNTGTGFINDGAWITGAYGSWNVQPERIWPMDVNGDGLTDIVIGPDSEGKWYVLRSTGTSFVNEGTWITGAYGGFNLSANRIRPMDVNGDGLTDVVIGPESNGNWYVLRSTGTSFINDGAWITGAYGDWYDFNGRIRSMDVNGDGLPDIVIGPESNGNWYVLRNTGNSFVNEGAWITGAYGGWWDFAGRIRSMDANGDGLADIVIGPESNGNWYVLRSTGKGFVNDGAWITGAYGGWYDFAGRIRSMDVNGDGAADIVIGPESNGNWYVLRSTGTSFVNDGTWITGAYGSWYDFGGRIRPIDVNGDGLPDIMIGPESNGNWYVLRSRLTSERASKINPSAGSQISFTHAALSVAGGTYTKDSGPNASVYPKLDIQSPMYVVSSVSSSNGIGGTVTTNYKYGGLKAEIGTGRGLLGFRWMESTQAETGIITRTEYRQDWPYVGLPSIVKKSLPGAGNNGLLSQVSNSYSCLNPQSGSACTISTGNRYFPYLSQSVESSWDLNGTALPIVTTTHQFDAWGNATQVTVGTNDGYSKTTTNQYSNDATNWYLGRLTRSQVQSVTP